MTLTFPLSDFVLTFKWPSLDLRLDLRVCKGKMVISHGIWLQQWLVFAWFLVISKSVFGNLNTGHQMGETSRAWLSFDIFVSSDMLQLPTPLANRKRPCGLKSGAVIGRRLWAGLLLCCHVSRRRHLLGFCAPKILFYYSSKSSNSHVFFIRNPIVTFDKSWLSQCPLRNGVGLASIGLHLSKRPQISIHLLRICVCLSYFFSICSVWNLIASYNMLILLHFGCSLFLCLSFRISTCSFKTPENIQNKYKSIIKYWNVHGIQYLTDLTQFSRIDIKIIVTNYSKIYRKIWYFHGIISNILHWSFLRLVVNKLYASDLA